jgi:hypothetical protein
LMRPNVIKLHPKPFYTCPAMQRGQRRSGHKPVARVLIPLGHPGKGKHQPNLNWCHAWVYGCMDVLPTCMIS